MKRPLAAASALVALALSSCDSDSPGPDSDAVLLVSAEAHDFGSVAVGSQSSGFLVTVTNVGDATTGQLSVILDGAAADEFLISDDACSGRVLQPEASCLIRVALRPAFSGAKEAAVRIAGRSSEVATVAVRGTSVGSTLSASPSSLRFPDTRLAVVSISQTVLVRNQSPRPSGSLTVELTGSHSADFEIGLDACGGASLPTGGACGVSVRFRPTATGERSATLRIVTESGAVGAELRGFGGLPATLAVTPVAHAFGPVRVGGSSETQLFSVTNSGTTPSGAVLIQATGGSPIQFWIEENGCSGVFLQPGASCTFRARLRPTTPGPKVGALTVSASFVEPVQVSLSGEGAILQFAVAPASFNFGAVMAGTTSQPQVFSIANTGTMSSAAIRTSVSVASYYYYEYEVSADYAIDEDSCTGIILAPGASCSVSVRFAPATLGPNFASLLVYGDVTSSPTAGAPVQGNGTGVRFTSPVLDFPPTTVGTTSATFALGVTNTGATSTGELATALSGNGFAIVSDECTGNTLAAGASCVISLRFAPGFVGLHQGVVRVTGSPGGTASASVRGVGM